MALFRFAASSLVLKNYKPRVIISVPYYIAATISHNSSYKATIQSMAFLFSGRCSSKARLDGKTALLTGCNTGIGKVNALEFYKRGCRVIMACRNLDKAKEAHDDIERQTHGFEGKGQLVIKHLDLSSLRSVRECASQVLNEEERIDILVNNAGVMMCPKSETEDGFEMQFGTNHLGHFLLTMLLLPKLLKSTPARIINVSSVGHKYGDNTFEDVNWKNTPYASLKAYGQSKLANIHFTSELARRLKGTGVTVYAVHPGYVLTELGRHIDSQFVPGFRSFFRFVAGWALKTPEQGAQTQIHCAVSEEAGKETGLYYADCRPVTPYAVAKDPAAAAQLWDLSAELVGYKGELFNTVSC